MKKKPRPDAVPQNQDAAAPDAPPPDDALFGRVATILEQARGNVVRAVNHNMVVAYWLIGREIVMELQRGKELRIPTMSITDSSRSRSLIPTMSIADSARSRSLAGA